MIRKCSSNPQLSWITHEAFNTFNFMLPIGGGIPVGSIFSTNLVDMLTRFQSNNLMLKGVPTNKALADVQREEDKQIKSHIILPFLYFFILEIYIYRQINRQIHSPLFHKCCQKVSLIPHHLICQKQNFTWFPNYLHILILISKMLELLFFLSIFESTRNSHQY